jgi:hypothetical protein
MNQAGRRMPAGRRWFRSDDVGTLPVIGGKRPGLPLKRSGLEMHHLPRRLGVERDVALKAQKRPEMHESAGTVARTDMGMQFPKRGRERHEMIFGEVSERVLAHTLDVDTLFDAAWFHPDAAGGSRPNVLIQCPVTAIPALIDRLSLRAEPPLHLAVVLDNLDLPVGDRGTLVIHDVSALTVAQQLTLYDWMTPRTATMQVIAITSQPLAPKMESGGFLQALLNRLTAVQATAGRAGYPA